MPAAVSARILSSQQVTGLVLSGGRGLRMDPLHGGTDKGLLMYAGRPLVDHVLQRLRPQVVALRISANRNLERYRAFGVPVVQDSLHAGAGPLAGVLAALAGCETAWLAVAPCDAPRLPVDLVTRLAHAALQRGTGVAVARCAGREHWTHLLVHQTQATSIDTFLTRGHRRVGDWCASQSPAFADFDEPHAFDNLNTPEDLARTEGLH